MDYEVRKATLDDRDAIAQLIAESARRLSRNEYSDEQIESAVASIFGVDTDLIDDETYYVAEKDGMLIGCGGWSRRKKLYGGDQFSPQDAGYLDPEHDPARMIDDRRRVGHCGERVGELGGSLQTGRRQTLQVGEHVGAGTTKLTDMAELLVIDELHFRSQCSAPGLEEPFEREPPDARDEEDDHCCRICLVRSQRSFGFSAQTG